ncbi:TonB-dependent receptor [Frateuria aurantia]
MIFTTHRRRTAVFVACCTACSTSQAFVQTTSGLQAATSAQHKATKLASVQVQASVGHNYDVASSQVATKMNLSLQKTPQTVNVIPRSLLTDQNALSMRDALKNVAGIGFSTGDGQRDQVTIRGFNGMTDQYVDGIRDDALYYRDLSNVQQIEVLKGAAAVLYGRGSAGGIINRTSKLPQLDPVEDLGITMGSQGQRRGEFDLGWDPSDRQMYRVDGAVEDSGNFRNQFELQRQAIAPSARFRLGDRTELILQADYLHDKRTADQGIPAYLGRPLDVNPKTYYGSSNAFNTSYNEVTVKSFTATLNHSFSDDLKLHTAIRGYDYQLERHNYFNYETIKTAADPKLVLDQGTRFRHDHGVDMMAELSQQTHFWGMDHQLLYGIEISDQLKFDRIYSKKGVATLDLYDPVLTQLPTISTSGKPGTYATTQIAVLGAYVQDLVTFSPQWNLLLGVRSDTIYQQRVDRTSAGINLDRTDQPISPRAGLIYTPIDWVSLYLSYSQSFQPLADTLITSGAYANDSSIALQKTNNSELGAKFTIASRATASIALFNMSQTHQQIADPNDTDFVIPIGTQRTRGVELSLTGQLTDTLSIYAGYAWLDGQIQGSAQATAEGLMLTRKAPALSPRNSISSWLRQELPRGFYVAAGEQYQSARFASPTNDVRLPGFIIFNLGGGYSSGRFEVSANLNNLFDRRYYETAHGSSDLYNMPGAPRNFMISARWHLR